MLILQKLMKYLQVEDLTKSKNIKMWMLNIKLDCILNQENLPSHKDFEQGNSLVPKAI